MGGNDIRCVRQRRSQKEGDVRFLPISHLYPPGGKGVLPIVIRFAVRDMSYTVPMRTYPTVY